MAGDDALAAKCEDALATEQEHLDKVRTWLAAGQADWRSRATMRSRRREVATLGSRGEARQVVPSNPKTSGEAGMNPNPIVLAVFDLFAIVLALSWMVRQW